MLKDHPVQHSMNIPQVPSTHVISPQLKSFFNHLVNSYFFSARVLLVPMVSSERLFWN